MLILVFEVPTHGCNKETLLILICCLLYNMLHLYIVNIFKMNVTVLLLIEINMLIVPKKKKRKLTCYNMLHWTSLLYFHTYIGCVAHNILLFSSSFYVSSQFLLLTTQCTRFRCINKLLATFINVNSSLHRTRLDSANIRISNKKTYS